ncbi:MAG: PAS domain-containing protein, partial [Anaerolineae bacterium]|nr:PAS domain-containing protein [Anaerolineae bacterium]
MSIKQKLSLAFGSVVILFALLGWYAYSVEQSLNTTIVALLGILLTGGIGYFTVTAVIRPLTTLKEAAVAIGEGKLDTTIHIETEDEIGILADFMNSMAGDLSGAFGQLEWTLNHLRAIIDNLVDGLLVTNTDGKITVVNPALIEMFELQDTNLMGKSCDEVFDPHMPEIVRKTIQNPLDIFETELPLAEERFGKAVARAIVKRSYDDEKAKGNGIEQSL